MAGTFYLLKSEFLTQKKGALSKGTLFKARTSIFSNKQKVRQKQAAAAAAAAAVAVAAAPSQNQTFPVSAFYRAFNLLEGQNKFQCLRPGNTTDKGTRRKIRTVQE